MSQIIKKYFSWPVIVVLLLILGPLGLPFLFIKFTTTNKQVKLIGVVTFAIGAFVIAIAKLVNWQEAKSLRYKYSYNDIEMVISITVIFAMILAIIGIIVFVMGQYVTNKISINDQFEKSDLTNQLQRLYELKEKGILTQEEFEMQKQKVLR